jgi:hypothetical protein
VDAQRERFCRSARAFDRGSACRDWTTGSGARTARASRVNAPRGSSGSTVLCWDGYCDRRHGRVFGAPTSNQLLATAPRGVEIEPEAAREGRHVASPHAFPGPSILPTHCLSAARTGGIQPPPARPPARPPPHTRGIRPLRQMNQATPTATSSFGLLDDRR